MERKAMTEMRELTDMEVASVSGGVGISDLGAYIAKEVDKAVGAALGGGKAPGGIDPGFSPHQPGVYPQPYVSPQQYV
jgi:hypothetical protein